MKKTILASIGALGSLGIIALVVLGLLSLRGGKLGGTAYPAVVSGEVLNYASNIVGTHVGTSTVGVWTKALATTTYVTKIGGRDTATYQAIVTLPVTSTGATVNFLVQGSNDFQCDTTNTSTASFPNSVIESDINWFSVGDNLRGKTQTTAFNNASSTNLISWSSPDAEVGQTIQLEDLNYQCLKLSVGTASTTLFVGLTTR